MDEHGKTYSVEELRALVSEDPACLLDMLQARATFCTCITATAEEVEEGTALKLTPDEKCLICRGSGTMLTREEV